MPKSFVRVSHVFNQPVDVVFDTLADHEQLSRVFGVPVKRIRDGEGEDVNGVGSTRRIGLWPVAVEETVTDLAPGESIGYQITRGGFPIRDHRGKLFFKKTADGCEVKWNIEFRSAVPGAGLVVKTALTEILTRGLARLD